MGGPVRFSLIGDGPALDQLPEAAELVEHAVERGHELGPVRVALRDRDGRGGRRSGERHEAARAEADEGGRADQELPARHRGNRAPARWGHAETSSAQYTGTGGRWNSTPGSAAVLAAGDGPAPSTMWTRPLAQGLLEPRGHRAAGIGHREDERVQDPGAAVRARGVVELRGAGVEERAPGRSGGSSGAARPRRGGRDPRAPRAATASLPRPQRETRNRESQEPSVFHPSRLPSRRRDQGPPLFGERIELPREIPRGRSGVDVQDGVEAGEGRLEGSALLENTIEAALPGQQVEHLEREELVGAPVGRDRPRAVRPGTWSAQVRCFSKKARPRPIPAHVSRAAERRSRRSRRRWGSSETTQRAPQTSVSAIAWRYAAAATG